MRLDLLALRLGRGLAVRTHQLLPARLEATGERICNLERAFQVREGVDRSKDMLPHRVMHEPIPDGPHKGMYCPPEELEKMLSDARSTLLETRRSRIHPGLDDKVLTDWNGLMIGAMARGSRVLGEERFLASARRAAG